MPAHLPPLPCPPPRSGGDDWLLIDPLLRILGAAPLAALGLARPGSPVTLRQGRLHAGNEQAALERAVQLLQAPRGPARLGLMLPRNDQAPLTLALHRGAPLPQTLWLRLVWPEQLRIDAELLGSMFRLTTAEQRVALALADGYSTRETAEQLGVQENTVRGHIKQLLAKTHTQRQAELTALLWRSAAVMHGPASTHPPSPGGVGAPGRNSTQMGKDSAGAGFDTAPRSPYPTQISGMS